ncbi:hypothetical protein BO71DRAFT_420360 [Aspergillus ellipticus CBS 707.79]|uniref:Uncharacterized protein n=1 Tax=Aspergillus ellipticus CBS 707.79 TaxID=1448320 RepID=A0A319EQ28_9EURO|nr:hypothetical protein BO71DRAFT_420360 [Aspergillus ellipticus CBS 707.79]
MLSSTGQSEFMRRGFWSRYSHETKKSQHTGARRQCADLIESNPCYGSAIATGKAGLETSEVRQPVRESGEVANRVVMNPAPERGRMRDYSSADVGDQLKRIGPS